MHIILLIRMPKVSGRCIAAIGQACTIDTFEQNIAITVMKGDIVSQHVIQLLTLETSDVGKDLSLVIRDFGLRDWLMYDYVAFACHSFTIIVHQMVGTELGSNVMKLCSLFNVSLLDDPCMAMTLNIVPYLRAPPNVIPP